MIRKAIIVVLTLGAVGTLLLGTYSLTRNADGFHRTVAWGCALGKHDWLEVSLRAGEVLVVHRTSDDPVFVETFVESRNRRIAWYEWFVPWWQSGAKPPCFEYGYRVPLRVGTKQTSFSFARFSVLAPVVLFAGYPTIAFIRGPVRRWRRRKRGECVGCGYNLTGLPEPRCPECGVEIKAR